MKNIIDFDALSNLSDESLSELLKGGIIGHGDAEAIEEIRMAKKLKEYKKLVQEVHHFKVSEPNPSVPGSRYKTRILVYDPDKCEYVKRQLTKTHEYDFYEALYRHYTLQSDKEKESRNTIQAIYPKWLEYKKLHTTTPTYITRIESDWKRYYVGSTIVEQNVSRLTMIELDEWAHSLIKDNGMTKTNYYNATVIMRQLLDYAVDAGIISDNKFRRVHIDGKRMFQRKAKPRSETQVFSPNEVTAICDIAFSEYKHNDNLVYRLAPLAVVFQFQTGLRVGELCGVKFSDIDGDYIHIQRMVRMHPFEVVDHTKTDLGERMVFLTQKAKDVIAECKMYQMRLGIIHPTFIFSASYTTPLKPNVVHDKYRSYCGKLGITPRSSHKARKTFASTLLDAGVNIDTVRKMMGHADERTTLQNYTFDRNEKKLREKMIEKALGT